jgi:hypothetical protein
MHDADGPEVSREVYQAMFSEITLNSDAIPFALDVAARKLRARGVPMERWATYVHIGV